RPAPAHVFEPGCIRLAVWNELDRGTGMQGVDDAPCQVSDAHFLGGADVEDFAAGCRKARQPEQRLHGIADIAKATRLAAVPKNPQWASCPSGLDEPREHHSIAARLARAYGIE